MSGANVEIGSFQEFLDRQDVEEGERAATWTADERVERFVVLNEADGHTVDVTWNDERTEATCEVLKSDGFIYARATIAHGELVRWS